MTLGNLMALRQDDVVRLLAWSTVAQAGAGSCCRCSASRPSGSRAAAGYLLTYLVATLVAFTVVVRSPPPPPTEPPRCLPAPASGSTRTGASSTPTPWAAGALLLALTLARRPAAGQRRLVGKIVALRPVLAEGWWVVAVLAAGNAVLGAAVYLRWVRVLVQDRPAGDPGASGASAASGAEEAESAGGASVTTRVRTRMHPSHAVALGVGTALLVLGSVQPQLLLGLLG